MKLLVHAILTIALLHVARAIAPHQEPWTGLFALLLANDYGVTFALNAAGGLHKHRLALLLALAWAVVNRDTNMNPILSIAVPAGAGMALGLLLRRELAPPDEKGALNARPPEPVPERRTQPAPNREPERSSGRGRGAGG